MCIYKNIYIYLIQDETNESKTVLIFTAYVAKLIKKQKTAEGLVHVRVTEVMKRRGKIRNMKSVNVYIVTLVVSFPSERFLQLSTPSQFTSSAEVSSVFTV